MKGIGPNNLGMSKMAGSDCCGIPNCGCGDMPEAPGKIAGAIAGVVGKALVGKAVEKIAK
jgi:hypothetical protein